MPANIVKTLLAATALFASATAGATALPPLSPPVTFHGLAKEVLTVPNCGTDTTGATISSADRVTLTLNADHSMSLAVTDAALSPLFTISGSWFQSPLNNQVKLQMDGQLSEVTSATSSSWATLVTYLENHSLAYCQSRTTTALTTTAQLEPASVRLDEFVLLLDKKETGGVIQMFLHSLEGNDAQSPGNPDTYGTLKMKLTAVTGP